MRVTVRGAVMQPLLPAGIVALAALSAGCGPAEPRALGGPVAIAAEAHREGPGCDRASVRGKEATDCFSIDLGIERCTFASTGRTAYFVLEPGYGLVLAGEEDGEPVRVEITVLDETRTVAGVETRVVEEREWEEGKLEEVSRNFVAICAETGSVFYFGEEVEMYEDGELEGSEGEWLAGEDGARPGLLMPGVPLLGSRFYQEFAPGRAMDRAEITEAGRTVTVPAGTFEDCIVVHETSPLEPKALDLKIHAPGIGMIVDEGLRLVEYSDPSS